MTAINNLKGHIIKDGKVVYSEQLENNLHFAVVLMYEPFYDGKNNDNHQNSSQLICQAVITTGKKHTWGNGVTSIEEAVERQRQDNNGKWPTLQKDLKTKDGHRVWQKDYQYHEKTRMVIWLVEVPKLDLLKYCKID